MQMQMGKLECVTLSLYDVLLYRVYESSIYSTTQAQCCTHLHECNYVQSMAPVLIASLHPMVLGVKTRD